MVKIISRYCPFKRMPLFYFSTCLEWFKTYRKLKPTLKKSYNCYSTIFYRKYSAVVGPSTPPPTSVTMVFMCRAVFFLSFLRSIVWGKSKTIGSTQMNTCEYHNPLPFSFQHNSHQPWARIYKRSRNPGIDSASLCNLASRYDNPICSTRLYSLAESIPWNL